MADRKITLKRNNAGDTEVLYPTTTVDQLFTGDGQTAVFSGNKIKVEYLPDAVFDSLLFYGTIDASGSGFATSLEQALQEASVANRSIKGYYWVVSAAGEIDEETSIVGAGGEYFQYSFDNDDAGQTGANSTSTGTVEVGDWIVCTSINDGDGTELQPYILTFSVVNNTYEKATTAAAGIVELATNTETTTGTDTERAVTPAGLASVLTSYVTTDNDTTYSVALSGADDNISLDLNAGGSGSGTDSITFTAGSNIALNLTGDNMEIDFTGTIPTITLNNTATTSPSFYAPTASGTAGSSTVSRQGLFSAGAGAAPTWVDAPKVFYDDTTGWLHGDIVIDVDA